ncbi:Inositol 2-dehydrogenase [Janthinobacterium lividum]|nr:Inositol 2-dehydrogenase [Janthinobacterium lividum]
MIEVALFGAGRIGKIHAANLAAQPGVQFKYVVDVNQEAAAALAGLHGGSSATVEAALADPAIKAVVIASSTDTHADLILRSAAAGKAIFAKNPST